MATKTNAGTTTPRRRRPRAPRRAKYATVCGRCELVITPGSPYAMRNGRVIHTHCASGADD